MGYLINPHYIIPCVVINLYISNNINSSVSANPAGDIVTDFNKLVLAEGPLPQAIGLNATIAAGVITISWNGDVKDYLPNQSASDQLSVAVCVQHSFTSSKHIFGQMFTE